MPGAATSLRTEIHRRMTDEYPHPARIALSRIALYGIAQAQSSSEAQPRSRPANGLTFPRAGTDCNAGLPCERRPAAHAVSPGSKPLPGVVSSSWDLRARHAASSNGYRVLVSSRMTGYEANPTRYLSPVGAGTPPSGSSVTAMATGAGMSGGVSNDAVTLPLSSGRMSPALIGRLAVTTQS